MGRSERRSVNLKDSQPFYEQPYAADLKSVFTYGLVPFLASSTFNYVTLQSALHNSSLLSQGPRAQCLLGQAESKDEASAWRVTEAHGKSCQDQGKQPLGSSTSGSPRLSFLRSEQKSDFLDVQSSEFVWLETMFKTFKTWWPDKGRNWQWTCCLFPVSVIKDKNYVHQDCHLSWVLSG